MEIPLLARRMVARVTCEVHASQRHETLNRVGYGLAEQMSGRGGHEHETSGVSGMFPNGLL